MREKPLILIVDDEDAFLEILGTKLRSSGYEVGLAHNEAEALAQAEALLPDLILMDIHMPGRTGTDAALGIKQNPKTKDIKIAFLTSLEKPWPGIAVEKNQVAAKEMGAEEFLRKDEDLGVTLNEIKNLLSK